MIAISLIGVIVLGVTSFDVGSRQFLKASERKTQVLNEAALISDRITKDALTAIGTVNQPALTVAGGVLTIVQDSNANGRRDAADTTVVYQLVGNQVQRVANTTENLTNRAIGFVPTLMADTNTVQIVLTLRFNPARAQDAFDNPEMAIQTNIEVPGWSLR